MLYRLVCWDQVAVEPQKFVINRSALQIGECGQVFSKTFLQFQINIGVALVRAVFVISEIFWLPGGVFRPDYLPEMIPGIAICATAKYKGPATGRPAQSKCCPVK